MPQAPSFDRVAPTRPAADALLADDDALVMPLWRGQVLLTEGESSTPRFMARKQLAGLVTALTLSVYLGQHGGRPLLAVALPADREVPEHPALAGQGRFMDLRLAGNLVERHNYRLLAYARGVLQWHRSHAHCPRCGGPTKVTDAGHVRFCDPCDRKHFPRTDPAIMAMITYGDRILLARQSTWAPGFMSVLAGFVEPGESLEGAVAREVREEVGLEVRNVRYLASQPWPFPRSLMIGFVMEATHDRIVLGDEELESAAFYSREQILAKEVFTPPRVSLAHQLIQRFLDDRP